MSSILPTFQENFFFILHNCYNFHLVFATLLMEKTKRQKKRQQISPMFIDAQVYIFTKTAFYSVEVQNVAAWPL